MKGKLISLKPELMSKEYFFKLCEDMNIPTNDENLVLNDDLYRRIINNKDIMIAQYNTKLYKLYKEQVTKIKKIDTKKNKRADEIQKEIENDFKTKRDEIRYIEQNEGQTVPHKLFDGFKDDSGSLTSPVRNVVNTIRPARVSYEKDKFLSGARDNALNTLYKAYDNVKNVEVYSNITNGVKQKILNHLSKRIKDLQTKQSVAFLKQNRIINKNAKAYIERRYRQFEIGSLIEDVSESRSR